MNGSVTVMPVKDFRIKLLLSNVQWNQERGYAETKKPKLQASKELWEHVLLLTRTDKESFEGGLADWYTKWKNFLNERKPDPNGKNRYVHKRLRSAYRSLKTNGPWLFTWYDDMELKIPTTTNAIDGHFADLKNKLKNHNGLSTARKKKFIDAFLKA